MYNTTAGNEDQIANEKHLKKLETALGNCRNPAINFYKPAEYTLHKDRK